ncbi:MAG: glutaredoxin [Spirochaetales bacterium]|nr:glutaredoxin [Spirochaetales bacterium]
MFEYLDFKQVDGNDIGKELKLIALSTCSFCKRGKAYLEEKNIKHSVVDMDSLDPEVKKRVRADFKEKFKDRITFPALIIDDEDVLTGFIRFTWKEKLGIEN